MGAGLVAALQGPSIDWFSLSPYLVLLGVAVLALAIGGAADMISVFIRGSLVPLVTPDDKRGRVMAVENVFIGASNELGAFESGIVAQAAGTPATVIGGGIATVAIVVLALITVFLLREGAGFFGQNRENLRIYRQAGLEYVDFIRAQVEGHTALTRELSALRLQRLQAATAAGQSPEAANAGLKDFDAFADKFLKAAHAKYPA